MGESNVLIFHEHLVVLTNGLFWSLLIAAVAWKCNFFQFKRKPYSFSPVSLGTFLGAFFIFLTIELMALPICVFLWMHFVEGVPLSGIEKHFNPIEQGWFNIFAIALAGIGLLLYQLYLPGGIRRQVWGDYAFTNLKSWMEDLFIGISTWLICFPMLIVLTQLLDLFMDWIIPGQRNEQVAVTQLKTSFNDKALFWANVGVIICIVPIIEETLFRGFLLNWLKKDMGAGLAIVITAATFAFFHFSLSQGWDNISLLTSLFLLGCFLGFIYERQQSLWAPIGLHAAFNAISILMIVQAE